MREANRATYHTALESPEGPLLVDCQNVPDEYAHWVENWFRGEITDFKLDGERSVIFANPDTPGKSIKIKGAGLKGGPIRFGQRMASGLRAPAFDFEGRMMDDQASTHDNAWLGGASFQQAAVEYKVSALLSANGYQTVPCVGYGSVLNQGLISWFSVFELADDWRSYGAPHVTTEEYLDAKLAYGHQVKDMATRLGVAGYYWYLKDQAGKLILKDLHPFRTVHPVNTSQNSWTMRVFHALHIGALSTAHFTNQWHLERVPKDAPALVFRAFCPDATKEDHDAVRFTLVGEYMKGERASFDPDVLCAFLRKNKITGAIMDACPDQYARYHND